MKKYLLLTTVLLLNPFQRNYFAQAADSQAIASATSYPPKRPKATNLERLHTNFADLKKEFATLSDTSRAAFNQKLSTVKKLLERLQHDKNAAVATIQAEILAIESQIAHAPQAAQLEIPPLPSEYASAFYPLQDEQGINFLDGPKNLQRNFDQITQLPKGFSPDRGWIIVHNGLIKKYMTDPRLSDSNFRVLAKKLFNISQEGNVVRTTLPNNPAISLNPTTGAQLVRLLYNDLLSQEAITDFDNNQYLPSLVNNWHQAQLQVPGGHDTKEEFIKECKKIIRAITTCAQENRELTTDFLLAVVALEVERGQTPFDSAQVFQEYVQALLGKEVPLRWYYETLTTGMTSLEKSADGDLSLLLYSVAFIKDMYRSSEIIQTFFFTSEDVRETYHGLTFPSCGENTLRTIVSLLLFDPKTKTLSLDAIPQDLRADISEGLKIFIAEHGALSNEQKASTIAAANAWVQLVENRADIAYNKTTANGEKCEIDSSPKNMVLILTQLLGIPIDTLPGTPAEQFAKLTEKFSTNDRPLQVTIVHDSSSNQAGKCGFKLFANSLNIELEVGFAEEHALVKNISKRSTARYLPINKLLALGNAVNQFLLGATQLELSTLCRALTAPENSAEKPSMTTTNELKEFLLNKYSSGPWGSNFPKAFYTINFYEEMALDLYALAYEPRSKEQKALISTTINELGFTQEGALEEALSTHNRKFVMTVLKYGNCAVSEQDAVKILVLASEGNRPEIKSLLSELKKRNFQFHKTYLLAGKEQTPLAWACAQKNSYLVNLLLRYTQNKYNLTPAELAEILELFNETNFVMTVHGVPENQYDFIMRNLEIPQFDLNMPLPFSTGNQTLLDWVLMHSMGLGQGEEKVDSYRKGSLLFALSSNPLVSYSPNQVVSLLETIAQDLPASSYVGFRFYTKIIDNITDNQIDFLQPYQFKEGLFTPLEWLEHTKVSRSEKLHNEIKEKLEKKVKEQESNCRISKG